MTAVYFYYMARQFGDQRTLLQITLSDQEIDKYTEHVVNHVNDAVLQGFNDIDWRAYGDFPFYSYVYGISCDDGIKIQLTMKPHDDHNNENLIVNELDLKCEFFEYWDNVHFTIPQAS